MKCHLKLMIVSSRDTKCVFARIEPRPFVSNVDLALDWVHKWYPGYMATRVLETAGGNPYDL